jgi:hypothetical protein
MDFTIDERGIVAGSTSLGRWRKFANFVGSAVSEPA